MAGHENMIQKVLGSNLGAGKNVSREVYLINHFVFM